MNIFFEISDSVAYMPDKYLAAYSVVGDFPHGYISAMRDSERVWREDESGVRFIKNRIMPLGTESSVDMKEFFWIKLKSVKI